MFHKTFLSILRGQDPLQKTDLHLVNSTNFDALPKTVATIEKLACILIKGVQREQELIETHTDYYVARDTTTNVVYVCFKDLLVIDIDVKKLEDGLSVDDTSIMNLFNLQDYTFKIYKSNNGYHVFCISQPFEYRNSSTMSFMLKYYCDFYYAIYCYIRGFSVRLNKKFIETQSPSVYTLLGTIGNKEMIDSRLLALVNLHYDLSIKYNDSYNIN